MSIDGYGNKPNKANGIALPKRFEGVVGATQAAVAFEKLNKTRLEHPETEKLEELCEELSKETCNACDSDIVGTITLKAVVDFREEVSRRMLHRYDRNSRMQAL